MATKKKPTMAEIKKKIEKNSPFYFDRKTMKHFGQTMKSFKVHQTPKGRVFIYAKTQSLDHRTGKYRDMGYSIREFIDNGMDSDLKVTRFQSVAEMKKTL